MSRIDNLRDAELAALIEESKARVATMSDEEREGMYRAQQESWVRGEMAIGLDRKEREARAALIAEADGKEGA
jgi:hypothetical protein